MQVRQVRQVRITARNRKQALVAVTSMALIERRSASKRSRLAPSFARRYVGRRKACLNARKTPQRNRPGRSQRCCTKWRTSSSVKSSPIFPAAQLSWPSVPIRLRARSKSAMRRPFGSKPVPVVVSIRPFSWEEPWRRAFYCPVFYAAPAKVKHDTFEAGCRARRYTSRPGKARKTDREVSFHGSGKQDPFAIIKYCRTVLESGQ